MTVHIDVVDDEDIPTTYEAYCIQCLSYFGWSRHYRETKEAIDRHTCNPQILKQEKEHMTYTRHTKSGAPTQTSRRTTRQLEI